MLVEFTVKNYKSYKESSSISLLSDGDVSGKAGKFSVTGNKLAPKVSHVVTVFGANGAGKSAIIDALDHVDDLVYSSATKSTHGDKIAFHPFKLSKKHKKRPSEFEVVFLFEKSVFQYGFSHNAERFMSEWLYERPSKKNTRTRNLFYREYDKKKKDYDWYINPSYIKNREKLKKGTRENSLFLSSAVRDNSKELIKPFEWFRKNLRTLKANQKLAAQYTSMKLFEGEWKEEILQILKSADLRFDDVSISEEDIEYPDDILESLSEEMRNTILERTKEAKRYTASILRRTIDGEMVAFDLNNEESTGTKSFYALAGPILDVLKNGRTLVVDELNSNLHPHLMKYIIQLFNDRKKNQNGAQLIFTSHDTFVMNPELLSDDQIWFVEKDDQGVSETFSLGDIKGRRSNRIWKSYLDGRYGAVPKISR